MSNTYQIWHNPSSSFYFSSPSSSVHNRDIARIAKAASQKLPGKANLNVSFVCRTTVIYRPKLGKIRGGQLKEKHPVLLNHNSILIHCKSIWFVGSFFQRTPRQTGRNCVSMAAALRAKQGPCEPGKYYKSKAQNQREPEWVREWHREPVGARMQARKSQGEPEKKPFLLTRASPSLALSASLRLALSGSVQPSLSLTGSYYWLSIALSGSHRLTRHLLGSLSCLYSAMNTEDSKILHKSLSSKITDWSRLES